MDGERKRFLGKLDRENKRKSQLPGEDEAPLPDPVEPIHADSAPGRNDPRIRLAATTARRRGF